MSGIAGIVLARPDRSPDQAILDAMLDRLAHRGPDESGSVIRGPAALGIRRLRTVDLSTGRQPMTGEDGRTWVVFDGDVYNYRELTNRLAASGHVMRTRSDAEPIVHTWEVRGRDGLEDLEGIFGLAVWHEPSQTLVLARDRLGVKPLYYAVLPDQLVFASELRALLAHPAISRELDLDALVAYLLHGWVPAPRSIVRAVGKLPPAHRLVYAGGEAKIERWWDVRYGGVGPKDTLVGSAHMGAALDLAVRQQLRADVPLGILLSSGVDSAALVAIARAYTTGRVETFTLGFEDAAYDESAEARAVAEALGTQHHDHVVGTRAALDAFDGLADLVDEPLSDVSLVPMALLSRVARRSVTVALSGLGADEVFAGHEIYGAHRRARVWGRLPFTAPGTVERHARWMAPCHPDDVRELLAADALAQLSAPPSYEASHRIAEGAAGAAWLHQLLYLDLKGHLAEGALQALDRASMASSLQVRVPLLDRRVVEAAALLKPHLKLRALRTKHIFRRTMRSRLPSAVLARRPKALDLPLAQWFRGELGTRLRDACATALVDGNALFRRDAIERRLQAHRDGGADHARALYALLVFLEWARRHGGA